MLRFIRHISKIALLSLLALAVLDFAYTTIYASAAPIDKIALLRSRQGEKINYVFVGSSRVNNDIIPSVIEKLTGKTALNLGVNSARPHDVLTLVKLLDAYQISCDSIFVQVDYGYNHFESSVDLEYASMPFLWEQPILRDHIGDLPDSFALTYVPFYRYAAYDQKIGLHSLLQAVRQQQPSALEKSNGYMGRKGQLMLPEYTLPARLVTHNPYQRELEEYGRVHGLHLVYFTSPFSASVRSENLVTQLRTKIPALHDYSKAVARDALFWNQSHLNHQGAQFFTRLLVDDLLKKHTTEP